MILSQLHKYVILHILLKQTKQTKQNKQNKTNKTKQTKQNRAEQNKTKNIYVPNLDRYERKMLFVTFYELKPWIKKD